MSNFSRIPLGRDGERPGDRRFGGPARRPAVRWAVLALLLLVLAFGAWLGFSAFQVKSNLERARDSATQVKDALFDGDSNGASQWAQTAVSQAESAQAAAHSTPWTIAAAVPFLGSPFRTGQQMTDVVVGLAADVLRPAAEAGIGLSPAKLYSNGRVDVQLLRQQGTQLRTLSDSASLLQTQAAAIAEPAFLSPIRDARTQLQDQTGATAALLQNSALAADVAPAMMGADGPRSYLMAFQTNAEARGTGGLAGGFGVLRFDNGKPTVDMLAPNTELQGATAAVDLGPEFAEQYGFTNPFTDFRNSNISSHFPYAAQIWKSMWEREAGQRVDGVIAIDPVALSYILAAEGPVKLPDGEVVTEDNVVELTESTAYAKFPTDQMARKMYLQDIANAVVKETTGQVKSPGKMLDALGRGASERRIAVWSAFPAEQKVLEETPLGHAVPDDAAPYAGVVINNLGGNKMDYYLRREIEYAADGCQGDMRNSTISVKLTNTANAGELPEYITGTAGLAPGFPLKMPPGSMVTSVRVLTTTGARLTAVTSNGQRISAVFHSERGHPTYEVQVVIPPGQSGQLSFQLSEPTAAGEPRVPIQPLIDQVNPRVTVPTCS